MHSPVDHFACNVYILCNRVGSEKRYPRKVCMSIRPTPTAPCEKRGKVPNHSEVHDEAWEAPKGTPGRYVRHSSAADFYCILGSVERYPTTVKYTMKHGKRRKVPQESTSYTSADSNCTLGSVERYPTTVKYTMKYGKRKKVPWETKHITHPPKLHWSLGNNKHNGELKSGRCLL